MTDPAASTLSSPWDSSDDIHQAPTSSQPLNIAGDLRGLLAGRYELIDVLGQGGMSVVYRARDLELGEEIAIKALQPQLASKPGEVKRFKREILTARKIAHPNVVRIHDFGATEREGFISMEILEGGTLADRLENGERIPIDECMRIALGIVDGLAAAHAQGIIHRDIKPHNVLFDAQGNPKLADFGIARLTASTLTQTTGFVGTPYYMSPEQGEGLDVSAASDVYSVGVLLFELFSGQRPFDSDSIVKLAVLHAKEPPPSPRTYRPDIPRGIENIILRCLEKRPEDRFASGLEVGRALRSYQEFKRYRPRRALRGWALGGVLAGILLVAAGAGIVWMNRHPTTPVVASEATPAPTETVASRTPVPTPVKTPEAPATRTQTRATPRPAPTRRPAVARGSLQVRVVPWGTVSINGGRARKVYPPKGHTFRLAPGRYRIHVESPATGKTVDRVVVVRSGKTTSLPLIDLR